MYNFTSGESGLAFLSIPIGVGLTIPICLADYAYYVEPGLLKSGAPEPEVWLKPGLVGNFLVPIGLFIFAWTARSSCAAAILFGRPLFVNLGVAGVSFLAGLALLCSVGFYALYYFGGNLRKRSRFAVA
ncbi:hypothetical protein VE02_08157 [Pseudogymnoascus sp. 03VT05]|nr:hypothetical protein VE02_08157 [Pseudogymnoascus sp. 03VT05]